MNLHLNNFIFNYSVIAAAQCSVLQNSENKKTCYISQHNLAKSISYLKIYIKQFAAYMKKIFGRKMRESITAGKLLVVQGPYHQFITNKSDTQSIAWDLSWQQAFWKCSDNDSSAASLFSADQVNKWD